MPMRPTPRIGAFTPLRGIPAAIPIGGEVLLDGTYAWLLQGRCRHGGLRFSFDGERFGE